MAKMHKLSIKKKYSQSANKTKELNSVFSELNKLSDNYNVICNAIFESSNMDFVVVGPTGIFTIEVKSQDGPIAYNGKELTRWKLPFEKNILNQTMAEALSLHDIIKFNEDLFIIPVLVFSNFRTTMTFGLNPISNVFVIQKKLLLKLISDRPKIYNETQVSEITNNLSNL